VTLVLLSGALALAQDGGVVRTKIPTDAECQALGPVKTPLSFGPGEVLDYDIDAVGAKAGKMTMRTLPVKDGLMPIEITAQTNTFFSKVRRVNAVATTWLNPKTLRPSRYLEDAQENEMHLVADVTFPRARTAKLVSTINDRRGEATLLYGAQDGLDVAGTVFLVRELPLKEGRPVCFDVYGIRRMWRVWGKVLPREHVSLPVGEFDAWHVAGEAARLDWPDGPRRDVHVWVSDDAKRLPLAAIGAIDLGAVRATLTGVTRPTESGKQAETKANLKW
jgi:hypothetical protein